MEQGLGVEAYCPPTLCEPRANSQHRAVRKPKARASDVTGGHTGVWAAELDPVGGEDCS